MEFTTRFGLHSQTTRLLESALACAGRSTVSYGVLTLCDVPFQATWTGETGWRGAFLETTIRLALGGVEILNLSCSRFIRHY